MAPDSTPAIPRGFLPDLLRYVSCATWIDYDHDSDLDLFLGRAGPTGVTDVLLAYDPATSRYVDVSGESGLGSAASATTTVAWADFDRDFKWEVVKGSKGDLGSLAMYEQVDATISRPCQTACPRMCRSITSRACVGRTSIETTTWI